MHDSEMMSHDSKEILFTSSFLHVKIVHLIGRTTSSNISALVHERERDARVARDEVREKLMLNLKICVFIETCASFCIASYSISRLNKSQYIFHT